MGLGYSLMRLLFINRGGIGNCLLMTPAITWARWTHGPGATIAAAVEESSAPTLQGNPDLDDVLTIEEAAGQQWDIVVCPPPSPRGWEAYLARMGADFIVSAPDAACDVEHEAQVALRLVGWRDGDKKPPTRFHVSMQAAVKGDEYADCYLRRPRIGFAFGHVNFPLPGEPRKMKAWPLAYFARVAWALHRKGASIAWFGNEREETWLPRLRRPPAWAVMDKPLPLAAATLRRMDLLICNDNGLMHLANALGVKTLAVWGPTSQVKNAPWNDVPGSRIVSLGLPCQPCYRTNADPMPCHWACACMREIKPQRVVEEAEAMLND